MTDIHVPQHPGTSKISYGVYAGERFNYEIWLERDGIKLIFIAGDDISERAFERVRTYRRMRELAKSIGVRIQ